MYEKLLDKYRGVMAGAAVGDALGAGLEFLEKDEIIRFFGGKVKNFVHHPWVGYRDPGRCTDDTEMSVLIAKSIIERGRVDVDDIAKRFCEWFKNGPPDIGGLTARSLHYVCRGYKWSEAGKRAWEDSRRRSAGNGSLMRTHPVALFSESDEDVAKVSMITHYDPRCVESCIVAARIIRLLIGGEEKSMSLLKTAVKGIKNHEVIDATLSAPSANEEELETTGYVIYTLKIALWAFFTTDSFEEALIKAVNVGGDADTYGSVCGAIAGAFYGESGIPDRWRRIYVFDMSYEDVAKLGEEILKIKRKM